MSFITAFQNPDTGNISDDEYRLLRNLVYDECGIWLKDEKKSFLSARAQKRMKALNVASYFCYYKLLTDRKAGAACVENRSGHRHRVDEGAVPVASPVRHLSGRPF